MMQPSSPSAPPLYLPRGLIFMASLWLIGSWLLAIGVRAPVQPSSATYTPAVRLMLLCMVTGMLIAWPLLRLSQTSPAYPMRQTLLDLAVLIGLVQVVLWPLRLVTTWTSLRTAAIDATLVGWVALAGAVVAAGIMSNQRGPRVLAMLTCIALCLLGPALAWLGAMSGVDAMQLVELSPLMAVRTLGGGGGSQPSDVQWRWIILLNLAAVAVWLALALSCWLSSMLSRSSSAQPQVDHQP